MQRLLLHGGPSADRLSFRENRPGPSRSLSRWRPGRDGQIPCFYGRTDPSLFPAGSEPAAAAEVALSQHQWTRLDSLVGLGRRSENGPGPSRSLSRWRPGRDGQIPCFYGRTHPSLFPAGHSSSAQPRPRNPPANHKFHNCLFHGIDRLGSAKSPSLGQFPGHQLSRPRLRVYPLSAISG
jgi:hypothetical protein